jgi:hypothetical protein
MRAILQSINSHKTISRNMVSEDQIREEGLTKDDVLDVETEQPQQEVEWLPEWDEHPEEQPGENARIEDGVLIWERDGFEARLESYETTHWRATVTIPEEVGQWYPREFDLKCSPKPEYGFVESVETEEYVTTGAVLIITENFQPTWEVNAWIDYLLESSEQSQQFQDELTNKLAVASENED